MFILGGVGGGGGQTQKIGLLSTCILQHIVKCRLDRESAGVGSARCESVRGVRFCVCELCGCDMCVVVMRCVRARLIVCCVVVVVIVLLRDCGMCCVY